MSAGNALAALPVALPLLGASLSAGLRKWLNRAAADSLALALTAATLTVDILLLLRATHGTFSYWFGNWYPRGSMAIGIAFVVDPIAAGLATLAALLTLLALLFSWRYVESGDNHFQPLMLIFLAAMSGFVLTADLFNFFVFFELMSTSAFALCGLKTAEPAPLQGSLNFAITNSVAAFLVLTGIGLLYSVTGALNMAQIGLALGSRHDPLVLFAFTLVSCGFLVKGAIVPFHLWLPDAHAVAPTPVCVLFSGLMVELGIFALVRLDSVVFAHTFTGHAHALRAILSGFAIATVVLGGLMCYAEHHLKRLLAFSTICHAGLMLLAFALGGPLAIAVMLAYLLAHAFIKSGLFFTSGILLHHLRSISEQELFGRGRDLPWVAALWLLGGAGLAAAPPFATFLAEAGADHAGELAHFPLVPWVFLFGGAMTGAAVFRVGLRTFFGWGDQPITDSAAQVGELPETGQANTRIEWYHYAAPAICLACAVALTLTPGWQPILRDAAAALSSQAAWLHVLYTGQPVPAHLDGWREALPGAARNGLIATLLALLLALSSVFRGRLKRWLRLGAHAEHGFLLLRDLQSGTAGDYVTWLTVGVSIFGSLALLLLRR